MSDALFYSLALTLCLVMLCITLCIVIRNMQNTSGANLRALDRERVDYLHLINRLVERRDTPVQHSTHLAVQHGHERMTETNAAKEMEKEAIKRNGGFRPARTENQPATVDVSTEGDPIAEANAQFK